MLRVAQIAACLAAACLSSAALGEDRQPKPAPPGPAPATAPAGAPAAKTIEELPTLEATEAPAEATKVQTRAVLRDDCPITGGGTEEFALAGLAMSLFSAVLPHAIDKGVELAANYARQRGSDQETLADPSIVRIGSTLSLMATRGLPFRASAWSSASVRLGNPLQTTSSRFGDARRRSSRKWPSSASQHRPVCTLKLSS
jgi:hypothetical protein